MRRGVGDWLSNIPALRRLEQLGAADILLALVLAAGREVWIAGADGDVLKRLERLGITAALPAGRLVATKQEALDQAEALLMDDGRDASGVAPAAAA